MWIWIVTTFAATICTHFISLGCTRPAVTTLTRAESNQALWLGLFNLICMAPVSAAPVLYSCYTPPQQFRFIPELAKLALCYLSTETLFFIGHKALHTNMLYRSIHYVHHRFGNPEPVCAFYAHPVEFAVVNVQSVILAPAFICVHPSVFTFWVCLSIWSGNMAHRSDAGVHRVHHRLPQANFGIGLYMLDRWGSSFHIPQPSPYQPDPIGRLETD